MLWAGDRHASKKGKEKKRGGRAGGGEGGNKTPRPEAPRAPKHAKQETMGAQQGWKKKSNNNHKQGNPSP